MNDFSQSSRGEAGGETPGHQVEIYTGRIYVQGTITGSYKRISDVLNRKDRAFLNVASAAISPLGQTGSPRPLGTELMLARSNIHFVAAAPPEPSATEAPAQPSTPVGGPREFLVRKLPTLCYIFTNTFVIHGTCHILQGMELENLLEMGDPFLPVTGATIYMMSRPNSPWERDLAIVNKAQIEAMYRAET